MTTEYTTTYFVTKTGTGYDLCTAEDEDGMTTRYPCYYSTPTYYDQVISTVTTTPTVPTATAFPATTTSLPTSTSLASDTAQGSLDSGKVIIGVLTATIVVIVLAGLFYWQLKRRGRVVNIEAGPTQASRSSHEPVAEKPIVVAELEGGGNNFIAELEAPMDMYSKHSWAAGPVELEDGEKYRWGEKGEVANGNVTVEKPPILDNMREEKLG